MKSRIHKKNLLITSLTFGLFILACGQFSITGKGHQPHGQQAQTNENLWKANFPKSIEYVDKMPDPNNLWIFIMAGQSNMAGRGFVEAPDTLPNKRILTIDRSNNWIYAKEPLHFYEPDLTGLDCGSTFSYRMIESLPAHITIGIIPCAVGGTSIAQWLHDDEFRGVKLLSNFTAKVNLSEKSGIIKGILWHQGESDAHTEFIPSYASKLDSLFTVFRSIVKNDSLPILIGELGSFADPKEKQYRWDSINEIIHDYALKNCNVSIINTQDLNHRGDQVHFNSESQRILGKRFAEKYLELTMPATDEYNEYFHDELNRQE